MTKYIDKTEKKEETRIKNKERKSELEEKESKVGLSVDEYKELHSLREVIKRK